MALSLSTVAVQGEGSTDDEGLDADSVEYALGRASHTIELAQMAMEHGDREWAFELLRDLEQSQLGARKCVGLSTGMKAVTYRIPALIAVLAFVYAGMHVVLSDNPIHHLPWMVAVGAPHFARWLLTGNVE
jgi:cystathionine beta-lyase/cystathionine gamma-synthase